MLHAARCMLHIPQTVGLEGEKGKGWMGEGIAIRVGDSCAGGPPLLWGNGRDSPSQVQDSMRLRAPWMPQ